MRRLTRPVVLTTCLLGFFAAQFAVATPVLVVHGAVTRPNGSPAVGVTVAVTNVTRALSQEAPKPTDARGLYGVAFVDYLGDVARATDELLIQVIAAGSVLGEVTHLVTAAETVSTEVVVDVMLLDPPTFVYRNSWVSEPTAETKNGQADPGERVKPRVRLKNEGASDARNVVVALSIDDPDVTVVEGTVTHATWPTGEARDNVGFVVDIAPGTAAHDVDVTINVTADNGGPWRFSFSFPVVLPFPAFSQRNAWIFDPTPDAYQDGLAEPGERVRPRIRLANDGTADATNVRTTLVITDPDVTVISGTEVSAQWPRGDARNIGGFVVDISNRATPHDVTAIVTVTADSGGPWGFSFTFPIVAPTLTFSYRNSWIFEPNAEMKIGQADPGERVKPRVRLRNEGSRAAQNVVVALSTDDPDVTIVEGTVNHATWPLGEARDNVGFVVDIAPGTDPHDVRVIVDVSAQNGGPWQFSFTFPVVLPLPAFDPRNAWIYDPAPGAYQDGFAEAGERVRPRIRLRNDGTADATNVRVTLAINDPDVTVTRGDEAHTTWPRDQARTVQGFVVEIATNATPHDVEAVVTVTADTGGPWRFPFTFPVVAPTLIFTHRNSWVFEPSAETKNGQADPGERIHPRVRLKNEGSRDAQNVVVTLVSVDGQASVQKESVLHASWPAGEARTNVGHTAVISADASGSADFRIDVTADNGGPWQFPFTLPITPSPATFAYRNAWARDKTTGDGDGLAEPGERVELRVRLKNDGQVDAGVVTVTLSSEDVNVTVVDSKVTHSTWPGGLARNNAGFTVDLGESVGPSVAFAVDVMTDGGSWEFAFAVPIAAPAAPSALRKPEDIDRDGAVGLTDIVAFAPLFGASAASRPGADLNGDGVLDFADMVVIHVARSDLGSMAPAAAPSALSQTQAWIDEARARDDGSVVYQRGLPALERILRAMTPAATALLPNYPNPFNPETWIPFDIAEDADATVRIYDVTGSLVRRLDLGRLPPGSYRSRGDAAYWDGLNGAGERVASGVYVYELQAGSVRRARRMVVRK